MADKCPALVYAPGPCPRCGARTYTEAETMCQPSSDETGEYWCPAGEQSGDSDTIMQPTPESLAAEEAWYASRHRELLEREEAAHNATGGAE